MKLINNNDGTSALEESATPSPCLGARISMILPVFLRILILFAIVLVFFQTMIDHNSLDTAEDQNIFTHAGHPALRLSSEMSSGTTLQRFPYDSIDNRGNDNLVSKTFREPSILQEPVHACEDPPHDDPSFETMVVDAERGGEGEVYSPADHGLTLPCASASYPRPSSRDDEGVYSPPADNDFELTAPTARASCSSESASTPWIRNVSSFSMACETFLQRERGGVYIPPADHGRPWASANTGAADHGSKISAKIPLCLMRVCDAPHERGAGENSTEDRSSHFQNYFLSKPTTGRLSTTQQSTIPSAASPSSQLPGLITWDNEGLITLRSTETTSLANENTTTSTTHHEFGLIPQVTTSEFISLYVNSPCVCTVEVLSGIDKNASHSKLLFHPYNLYRPAESTPGGTIIFTKVLPIVYKIENPSLAVIASYAHQSRVAPTILIFDFIHSTLACTYDSVTTMSSTLVTFPSITSYCNESITFSNYEPATGTSLLYEPVCLQVFGITTPIQSSADVTYTTYLNESLDQKRLLQNHICFLLLITTFISYMLDTAASGVSTTNSVSFNQPCDNINGIFAFTYFAFESTCILSSQIFDNSAKSKKSWVLLPGSLTVPRKSLQISPNNIPDLHAMAAKSFQDTFNATNLYPEVKVVYYITTNILLQIYAIYLFIFFRVDDTFIEPSVGSNYTVNEIGTYDTFGIFFLHDVTNYIFNAFEIFFLHDVIAYSIYSLAKFLVCHGISNRVAYTATTQPKFLVSSPPVNPIRDSLLTWYAISEDASAPIIKKCSHHQTNGLNIFDLPSMIPLPQSPRLVTWCNEGLTNLCAADTANGIDDYTTIGISAYAFIFTTFYLWTATIIMVVVFVLRLLIHPMTNKVGMVRVWTGLGEIFDMRQINLLGRSLGLQRTSVSAYNTNMNDILVSTNSSSSQYSTSYYLSEYYKVMQQHFGFMSLIDDD